MNFEFLISSIKPKNFSFKDLYTSFTNSMNFEFLIVFNISKSFPSKRTINSFINIYICLAFLIILEIKPRTVADKNAKAANNFLKKLVFLFSNFSFSINSKS